MANKPIGTILVEMGKITGDQLQQALEIQKRQGGRIGWILSTLGMVRRYDLFEALSIHYDLPFVSPDIDTLQHDLDPTLLEQLDQKQVMELQAIPYQIKDNVLIVLNAYPGNPKLEPYFQSKFPNIEIRQMIITDLDFMNLMQRYYKNPLLDQAVFGLFYRDPEESAYKVFSKGQLWAGIVVWVLLMAAIFIDWNSTLRAIFMVVQILYVLLIGFKFFLSIFGTVDEIAFKEDRTGLESLEDDELPVYTILVPVFKEPEVVGHLIQAIKDLDYPQNKLDVMLLLEEVDTLTLEAAKAAQPPTNWRFLIVPKSKPQTKPKACNYGLFFARGTYLVIFDAEDIPEPDQIKKAYWAFTHSDPSFVCFQGALNYFNKNQNLLTRLFTLEYSYWFDYMLPGLFMLGLPIPLGGTSNHFKVKELRELGGWDPFNTTEDADLGIRASAEKYRVGIIRSTTFEEANPKVGNWIRQRSRWIKGYMQTALVYNRHPIKMLKTLGLKQWLSFQLFVSGTPIVFLLNPILWGIFLLWIFLQPQFLAVTFGGFLLPLSMFNLLIGNFLGVYMNMLGAFRRKNFALIWISLINPLYWLLHSIASYKALWQLITKPHYWEKTTHGLAARPAASPVKPDG